MELTGGTRVGPYEIGATIGAGGMGVVYRARDTRLGRDVALKVLPEQVQNDPERLRRFEQEARTTGALNHPNVVAVYDVGTHEGAPYLVTELLEGATVRARLREGPVPLRKALEWGSQIARGLAAAHEKGLVHRDLKPENLFITRDGRMKILDFGLAKPTTNGDDKDSPTLAETEPGAVMGTAGYMAPEQVRGRPADARSDIFACGAILYELLCGRRAFDGETGVERGYAILNSEPPSCASLDATKPGVPPGVERLVRRCLEKEPDERFQSARDLAFALEALGEPSGSGARLAVAAASARRRVERVASAVVVLAAVAAAFAVGSWVRGRRTAPAPAVAAAPVEPAGYTRLNFRLGPVSAARFADDGRSVIYSATLVGAPSQVYQAVPGRREARPVSPNWTRLLALSPSGEMALLMLPERAKPGMKGGTLARASLAGGAPREVMENVYLADFGPRDELMMVRPSGDQARIEYPAGKTLVEVGGWIGRARVSPDGTRVAFLHHPLENDDRGVVEVVDLAGARRTLAGPFWTLTGLAWSPDGREVWFGAAQGEESAYLHAVTLDGRRRVVTRAPGRLCLEDIARDGRVLFTRADTSTRVSGLVPGQDREIDLTWYDNTHPTDLTPDGSTFLFIEGGEASVAEIQTFLRKTDGSPAVHLAEGMGRALSPDGKWALISPKAPFNTLALVPTGPGASRTLPVAPLTSIRGAAFTPDGKRLVIGGAVEGQPVRLWILDLAGGAPRPLGLASVKHGTRPSPDGRAVAAWNDGRTYVVPLDGSAPQPLPRIAAADVPLGWADGGRALFLRRGWRREQRGAEVVIHDLATGKERPWRTLAPSDTTGMYHPAEVSRVVITTDGRSYAYAYSSMDTKLYVATGLK
jgi:eukaryotic-like serine/threonine-protein kinase